jgi:hypothetical protein
MGNKSVFFTSFAIAILLLATVVISAGDRRDVTGYNLLKERAFEGIVASKGHVIEGLMYFPLKTANSTLEVQIGPKEFLDRSGFKLNVGETVAVLGMPLIENERQIVLAREIRSMNAVLVVRDRFGLPLWEQDRPIYMDPERRIRFSDSARVIR